MVGAAAACLLVHAWHTMPPPPGSPARIPPTPDMRIDLDRDDVAVLTVLPRVGPVLAERIVAGRPFAADPASVHAVPGIGPATWRAIEPHVVGPGTSATATRDAAPSPIPGGS